MKKTGIELITKERQQQIEKHGWDINHDEEHDEGELVLAAIYALNPVRVNKLSVNGYSGWDDFEDKINNKPNAIERLKVAGALISAEIDRINHLK